MSRIELRNVSKRYGEVAVLNDINLTVEPGEFCVFIGPSGCGKSTLLRMLAGLEDITAGELSMDGAVVNDFPPARRQVAMVFQSYALYPHMTVYENMAFGLRHLKMPKDEIDRRVRGATASLHLEALLDRKPRALSGGQRQRVAIGRAIVRQPRVFLFDEPLSNLDAALRAETRIEIARLHRALGVSMVYVTHDQVEAMTLADKVVLLRPDAAAQGRPSIAQVGPPMALYERPRNRFVAGFIGSPAMNFLPARAAGSGAMGLRLRLSDGTSAFVDVDDAGVRSDDELTLGVRPEHVVVGRGAGRGVVTHVEQLGELTHVYLQAGDAGATLVAKVAGLPPRLQETVPFEFQLGRTHVFRPDGDALPPRAAAHAG